MAGYAQGSRIYNFCKSQPCPAGCGIGVQQYNTKECVDKPFSIGLNQCCGIYNVFWIRDEYVEADVAIAGWSPTGSGSTFNLVAPLYSGVYSPSGPRNKIGYFKLITSQFQYDAGEEFLNTDNYSFYWINGSQIVASMDSTYDYIGTEGNPFFVDNSTHNFNSTASAHQLLNKSVSVQLFAGVDQRQCTLTIKH
jgi:hypothetical protein